MVELVSSLRKFINVTGNKEAGAIADFTCYDQSMLVECRFESIV